MPAGCHRFRPVPEPGGLVPAFAAGWYDAPLRPLVLAHKEHRVLALARPLGRVLAGVIDGILGAAGDPGSGVLVVLVPVPSDRAAVRRRGHDPLARTVRAAARDLRRSGTRALVAPVLRQVRRVADQAGLSADARAANLAGSLAVRDRQRRRLVRLAAGRPVLLVLCDDVVTTGATCREAQRALTVAGLRPTAIAALAATRRRFPGPAGAGGPGPG